MPGQQQGCDHRGARSSIASFAKLVARVYPSKWQSDGTIILSGFCRACGQGLVARFDVEGRPA